MTSLEDLERRVAALEQELKQKQSAASLQGEWKDWRRSQDRYVPNEFSEAIDLAGCEIREAELIRLDLEFLR